MPDVDRRLAADMLAIRERFDQLAAAAGHAADERSALRQRFEHVRAMIEDVRDLIRALADGMPTAEKLDHAIQVMTAANSYAALHEENRDRLRRIEARLVGTVSRTDLEDDVLHLRRTLDRLTEDAREQAEYARGWTRLFQQLDADVRDVLNADLRARP